MKRALLCGVSAAVTTIMLGLAAPQALAADQPNASTTGTTVGEVVVTAEKRGGNLEKVPVAVTAFSAAQRDLLGIKSIQDLTDFTPGFSYTTFDNRPYMRGVGRQSDNLAIDPGVATYIDGVYAGANASTILQNDSLFIDRVEILRGPQTTLYGQNADGGAINMISKRPTQDFEEEVRAGIANYNKEYVEGVVSGPIDEHLRFRIGGNYTTQSGGYYDNLSGAREGGSVAQGGNGTSYHIEAQLEGDFGPKFDWWAKLASNDYNVSYHTETQLGPFGVSEFPNPLMPNQNYGLCSLPQYAGNLNCGGEPIVPGSLVGLPGASALNPANSDVRDFNGDFKSTSNENKDLSFSTAETFHADGFDVKYTFGYQRFYYDLKAPWVNSQGLSSSVEQYQLAGPTTATAACLGMFAANPAGCTQNLTVDPAQTQFTFIENDQFWSHELDFTSTAAGPLQWLAGVYYYGEAYDQPINVLDPNQPQVKTPIELVPALFADTAVAAPPNPGSSVYNEFTDLHARSLDEFVQFDYAFDPQWKLTVGLRDNDDTKSGYETFRVLLFDAAAFGAGAQTFGANTPALDATSCPAGNFPGAGPCTIDPNTGKAVRSLNAHWNAVTGTVNLSWTPDSTTLAYAKYSRGYKEGGFNSGTMAVFPETVPETVDAFEVGLKKTVSPNFQANVDAFYYNYDNEQQPLGEVVSGVIDTVIFNIPKSESYGLEWESTWRPIDNLTLNLNYAYLVAKITSTGGKCFEDTADPAGTQPGANTSGCPASPTPGTVLQNLTGQTLPESPKNKVTFDAYYTWRFDPGSLSASASVTWKDATYGSPFNRSYNLAPDYTQVNARLVWKDAKDRYSAILFCDNIFNAVNYDGVFGLNEGVTQTNKELIDRIASLTAPRTFGLELQYRFR
jgi:iron complex outermembrane receptor protein